MLLKVEELFVVLIITVVLFGSRKLPELGSTISESIREFRKGLRGKLKLQPVLAEKPKSEHNKV
ncbi:MAG TPA: twin-arginine translocase TatA/TatE family subunit [Candidatus Saccharimonadia bacterium]|nr:twin-arginine translocase TatA/TatE family subunit [Candidatus Saccharimonadia bacterium]